MESMEEVVAWVHEMETRPDRCVEPRKAAQILSEKLHRLEYWRAKSKAADAAGHPELRRGPPFRKTGKRILYEVGELLAWRAAHAVNPDWLSPEAAAECLGVHPRTLENWRRSSRRAEIEGKPELRRGPKFHQRGSRVWYEVSDLDEFMARGA